MGWVVIIACSHAQRHDKLEKDLLSPPPTSIYQRWDFLFNLQIILWKWQETFFFKKQGSSEYCGYRVLTVMVSRALPRQNKLCRFFGATGLRSRHQDFLRDFFGCSNNFIFNFYSYENKWTDRGSIPIYLWWPWESHLTDLQRFSRMRYRSLPIWDLCYKDKYWTQIWRYKTWSNISIVRDGTSRYHGWSTRICRSFSSWDTSSTRWWKTELGIAEHKKRPEESGLFYFFFKIFFT